MMKCEKLLENQGSDKFFHFSKLEVSWQIHNYGVLQDYAPPPNFEIV